MKNSSLARAFLLVTAFLVGSQTATAQLDRLYTKETKTPKSGTVMETSKNGIKFKSGANTVDYTPGSIVKVMLQGDPAPLTKAREFALDGQYEQAIDELKAIDIAKLPKRTVIKQEVGFYKVFCEGKLALEGRGDKNVAIRNSMAFVTKNSNSWHFYEVANLLGDLALSVGNLKEARKFYGALQKAPSTETKIRAVYLLALANLKDKKVAEAKADFEKVIGVPPATPGTVRLITLAKAGKAVALASEGKGTEGLKVVENLIAEMNPSDVELAARIYNAQGASYEAAGDKEGAIMAYLHTHLMYSSQPDAHAEALSRLVELFPQIGKPGRAAEARQELQDRYPGYGK